MNWEHRKCNAAGHKPELQPEMASSDKLLIPDLIVTLGRGADLHVFFYLFDNVGGVIH